jgi:hypothetical protein
LTIARIALAFELAAACFTITVASFVSAFGSPSIVAICAARAETRAASPYSLRTTCFAVVSSEPISSRHQRRPSHKSHLRHVWTYLIREPCSRAKR